MSKRGFTLIEIIVSIGILGLIAIITVPLLIFGYKNIFETNKFTVDTFNAQQQLEQDMEEARVSDDLTPTTLTLFGQNIEGVELHKEIKTDGESNHHGEMYAFIPTHRVIYEAPIIKNDPINIAAYRVEIGGSKTKIDLSTTPQTIFPIIELDDEGNVKNYVVLETEDKDKYGPQDDGIITDETKDDFLLNTFKWYLSKTPYPDLRTRVLIQESNKAKDYIDFEEAYDKGFIPNIENDYLELDFRNFYPEIETEEGETEGQALQRKINEDFGGMSFYFSITPFSDLGKVGREKESVETITTNRIVSVPALTDSAIIGEKYYPNSEFPNVDVEMASGDSNVSVYWTPTEWIVTSEGKVFDGKIIGYEGTLSLTVNGEVQNVTGFSIDEETLNINIGQEYTLTPIFVPNNATNKTVNWSSSNESVATVDTNGKVTGVAVGTATITGTTVDGGFSDTVDVTVEIGNLNSVNINGTPNVGSTLNAVVDPLDATGSVNYQWQKAYTDVGPFTNIVGATANEYILTNEDAGKYVRVEATGTGAYQGTVTSGSMEINPLQMSISASGNFDNNSVANSTGAYSPGGNVASFNNEADSINYTFGLSSLPNNAVVKGIEVNLIARESNGNSSLDGMIYKGSSGGSSASTGDLSGSNTNYTFGNDSNLWGFGSWTGQEINNDLNIRLSADLNHHWWYGWSRAYLDHLQINVYYTLP